MITCRISYLDFVHLLIQYLVAVNVVILFSGHLMHMKYSLVYTYSVCNEIDIGLLSMIVMMRQF